MQRILIICLFLSAFIQGKAQGLDKETLSARAEDWLQNHAAALPVRKVRGASLSPCIDLYPLFGCYRKQGRYVLLSRGISAGQVVGYGVLDADGRLPEALQALVESDAPELRQRVSKPYPPAGAEWHPVEPLLTSVRHQSYPYNVFCPHYKHSDGTVEEKPCVVGCVATAMEQVLSYYGCTYTLTDTLKGWTTERYTIPDVLPGASVDAGLILDNYDTEPYTEAEMDAVARLSYYLGVAVQMKWGVGSSAANSLRLVEPLQRAFGLPYVHYLDSYMYHPTDYWNFLASELMHHRPVYYAGSAEGTNGHAFVLDGLDENGMFHVNWGEATDYLGYFRLDVLDCLQPRPDRLESPVTTGFFCNQEAIAVCPFKVDDAAVPDTLTRTGREIQVERIDFLDAPATACTTRMRVALHNTSDLPLTTPFAFLDNHPADTALLSQARWIAFTGRTLQPGERDTVYVPVDFAHAGQRLLSVTADGEQILYSMPLQVAEGSPVTIGYDAPTLRIEDGNTAVVTQRFNNPSATSRASVNVYLDLRDDQTTERTVPRHCLYLQPQKDTTVTWRMRDLTPGHSYTAYLLRSWAGYDTLRFTIPEVSAIQTPDISGEEEERMPEQWYSLDGRRLPARAVLAPGVYIRKRGQKAEAVIRK